MIGVLARPEDARWVAEFFELFKTPWATYRPGGDYAAVLSCGVEPPADRAPVLVVCAGHELELDRAAELSSRKAAGRLRLEGEATPINGAAVEFGEVGAGRGVTRFRRGEQTVIRAGFDLFAEVRHLLTHGQPVEHAALPTLDRHIARLREWLVNAGVALVEIPPVPAGHAYTACLTHDVDHPEIRRHGLDHAVLGFLQRAVFGSVGRWLGGRLTFGQLLHNWGAVARLPFVHLGWARDLWNTFPRYAELERGLGSTFFVIPEADNPGREVNRPHASRRASAYGAADLAIALRTVTASGGEVGVHGLDAWRDADSGRREAALVAKAVGQECSGVRMHWLCWREESPQALEAAGFAYDSTVGYNETVGFRAGTAQVFRPAGVERLLELPLIAMDTAMLYPAYENLSPSAALAKLDQLAVHVRQQGGVLTVNWHDRSLAPERQWEEPYRELLTRLRHDGAWCPTAADAVAWFRRRRELRFEQVEFAGREVRVRVAAGEAVAGRALPGFRLRVWGRGGAMKEISFENELETTVTLPA
ncbi:MAG: hypothetical protein ACK45B_03955 [Limisphaerales bacterium]